MALVGAIDNQSWSCRGSVSLLHVTFLLREVHGLDGVTLACSPSPFAIHSSARSKKATHLVESVTRRSKRIAHITANLGSSTLVLIAAAVRRIVGLLIISLILPLPGHHSNEALPINHCLLLRGDKPMRMCPVTVMSQIS